MVSLRFPFFSISFFLMIFLFGCGNDLQERDSELIIDGELEVEKSIEDDAKAIEALF